MNKINSSRLNKALLLVMAGGMGALLSSCGGGNSGLKYEATDTTDRPPYFSVADSAVKDGSAVDASTLKPMPIKFFDDRGLKSYDLSIEGKAVSSGNLSGTEQTVSIDLSTYAGSTQYTAKLLVVDSNNQSTVAYFTINVKSYFQFMNLIGDATPNGWDNNNPTPMIVNPNNPAVFFWRGHLSKGDFKIATQEHVDWGTGDWIHPLTQGQSLEATDYVVESASGPDTKWSIPDGGDGTYSITVDQKAKTISIGKPLAHLFIVGDATPTGWNLGNATPLTQDPNNLAKFSLTIALGAGEFKLSSQTADWGLGDWLYYGAAGSALPTSPTPYDLNLVNNDGTAPAHDDNKWKVTPAQSGTYKISIDLDAGTIVAEKQ